MADKKKKLSDLLKESEATKPSDKDIGTTTALDAFKKGALVDAPASTIGLAGLAESFVRNSPFLPIPGYEKPEQREGENYLNAETAAQRFSALSERYGLLPKGSENIQPRGLIQHGAEAAGRVIGQPLNYLPSFRAGTSLSTKLAPIPRNLMGAFGGELAAEAAESGGALAQTGAGFAADSLLMLLSPRARAGFGVSSLNLGREGAPEVAEALSTKLDDLTAAENANWRGFESAATGSTMPGDPLRDVASYVSDETKYAPGATRPEVASTVGRELPDQVDVRELQKVRSAAREEASQAMGDAVPKKQIARNANTIRETADAMIDVIAQLSPADADAVSKLKAARAASRNRADLFPMESALYRNFFGGKARDNAQEAVAALLSSPQRRTEIGLVNRALKDTPSGQRAFRKAFVQAVLNAPEELASRAGTPALRKLDRYADVSQDVLGKKGAAALRRRLAHAAESRSASNDASMAMARMAGVPWPITRMLGGGAAAAAAAAASGQGATNVAKAAGVGAIVLPSLVYISEKFGPRAAQDAALEALLDNEMWDKLTRPLGGRSLPAYTKDLERAVVTRGLHLAMPDEEPQQPSVPLTHGLYQATQNVRY